jgi:hypothetical protein
VHFITIFHVHFPVASLLKKAQSQVLVWFEVTLKWIVRNPFVLYFYVHLSTVSFLLIFQPRFVGTNQLIFIVMIIPVIRAIIKITTPLVYIYKCVFFIYSYCVMFSLLQPGIPQQKIQLLLQLPPMLELFAQGGKFAIRRRGINCAFIVY